MLEKNYKLAEMIFLEQVMGEEGQDGGGALGRGGKKKDGLPKVWGGRSPHAFLRFLLCVDSRQTFAFGL